MYVCMYLCVCVCVCMCPCASLCVCFHAPISYEWLSICPLFRDDGCVLRVTARSLCPNLQPMAVLIDHSFALVTAIILN